MKDDPRQYMEVYLKANDFKKVASQGLFLENLKLQVLPCSAVQESAKVVNVTYSVFSLIKRRGFLEAVFMLS